MIAEAEDEKSSAFAVSQEDIDAVLVKGSSYADGKYRIYHQFQKRKIKRAILNFLKKKYGVSGGTPVTFSDGTKGYAWHDSKGISIDRGGISTEHDLVLSWAKIEKRLRELIKDNRYLNPKEKDHYADYLESISAPQYEIDTQRKLKRQRFIEEKGSCRLPTRGIRSPCGSLILSEIWTDMRKICWAWLAARILRICLLTLWSRHCSIQITCRKCLIF